MKNKITYLAIYIQFNNLKHANNKLFITVLPNVINDRWFTFKNWLNQDCMDYPDCKYCPYHTTLDICLCSVFSWKLD